METDYPSPDGNYTILISPTEMRMSHWVERPSLQDVRNNVVLFDLSNSLWSADTVVWAADSQSVTLEMRVYPGTRPPVQLVLWPAQNKAHVENMLATVLERDPLDRPLRIQYSPGGEQREGSFQEITAYLLGMA